MFSSFYGSKGKGTSQKPRIGNTLGTSPIAPLLQEITDDDNDDTNNSNSIEMVQIRRDSSNSGSSDSNSNQPLTHVDDVHIEGWLLVQTNNTYIKKATAAEHEYMVLKHGVLFRYKVDNERVVNLANYVVKDDAQEHHLRTALGNSGYTGYRFCLEKAVADLSGSTPVPILTPDTVLAKQEYTITDDLIIDDIDEISFDDIDNISTDSTSSDPDAGPSTGETMIGSAAIPIPTISQVNLEQLNPDKGQQSMMPGLVLASVPSRLPHSSVTTSYPLSLPTIIGSTYGGNDMRTRKEITDDVIELAALSEEKLHLLIDYIAHPKENHVVEERKRNVVVMLCDCPWFLHGDIEEA